MESPASREAALGPMPAGVRALSSLRPSDAIELGPEADDLARLVASGVAVASGYVVPIGGSDASLPRMREAIERALRVTERVRVRPMFGSPKAAHGFERRHGVIRDIERGESLEARMAELREALSTKDVRDRVGENLAGQHVRLVFVSGALSGRAVTVHPLTGDPDEIQVAIAATAPFRVDRKTTRVTAEGEGGLTTSQASQVADLADRAQLVLGRPLDLEWCLQDGRFVVVSLRTLAFTPCFTPAPFRRVALVAADEGTVAPLAIDALDKALRREDAPGDEARVRRIYARAYRRMDDRGERSRAADPLSIAKASLNALGVVADVAAPVAAATAFERARAKRIAALDEEKTAELDDAALVVSLRERQKLVVEALVLLDRGRVATLAVFAALEAALGTVPRECLPPLAHPRPVKERRRMYDRLARLARRVESERGAIVSRDALPPPLRREWDETRAALVATRALGIDVRPVAIGADDRALEAALSAGLAEAHETRERARRGAADRLLATARGKPLGRSREAIVASLIALLGRVAISKGSVAEGLAAALLRLRAAACEAGARLVEACVLDRAEDALYLDLVELEQALAGEPGAYAARVRLRREDDERWAAYEAPRWIDSRRGDAPLDGEDSSF